ncbi:MAG TPA: hypothetical protein VM681_10100 [Candidatus Thermoplasmatota archaeon]|nr:hypothetical protein [Candidatus Thermoplasmatota archaeon]
MPRAGSHARRDARALAKALSENGGALPPDARSRLWTLHRRIDGRLDPAHAALHAMRGPAHESAAEAYDRLDALARESARAAAVGAAAWRAGADEQAFLHAFARGAHILRDSFSQGHVRRAPGPGGPVVEAVGSWAQERGPLGLFAIPHVLRFDLRFDLPSWRFPEVEASDEAVLALARAVLSAAREDDPSGAIDRAWPKLRRRHLDAPTPPKPKSTSAHPSSPQS